MASTGNRITDANSVGSPYVVYNSFIEGTEANIPVTSEGLLITFRVGITETGIVSFVQIFRTVENPKTYIRHRFGSNWSSWNEL